MHVLILTWRGFVILDIFHAKFNAIAIYFAMAEQVGMSTFCDESRDVESSQPEALPQPVERCKQQVRASRRADCHLHERKAHKGSGWCTECLIKGAASLVSAVDADSVLHITEATLAILPTQACK
jgi:hypothetical protein